MSEGGRLLKAILDDPADMLTRSIYADWLEENSLAHPLRLASMRGQMPKWGKEARWQWAFPEFAGFAHANDAGVWIDGQCVRKGQRPSPGDCWVLRFHCGFLESCEVEIGWWMRHGPGWVSAHPVREAWASTFLPSVGRHPSLAFGMLAGWFIPGPTSPHPRPGDPRLGIWERLAGDATLHRLPAEDCAGTNEWRLRVSAACLGWAKQAAASGNPFRSPT